MYNQRANELASALKQYGKPLEELLDAAYSVTFNNSGVTIQAHVTTDNVKRVAKISATIENTKPEINQNGFITLTARVAQIQTLNISLAS